MDFEDLGKLQWELQAATDRAQRRYQEMRFANHRAEQAEKAAAEHEFYRRDAEIKHQREAVYLHEIIRKLQQQVHEEQEAKTKAETNAFELNNVIVKQEQEQEKLKREHAQTVQKAVAPLQQQMQHLFTQLRNAKAEQNRVVEQATLNLSVRCDKLEAAKNDLEDAKKALEEYKKDLEEKLVKSSEFYNTSLRTMQAQLMEERRFKDVLQKQNHFLQNRLQHHINGVRQEPPINAIATTLSPSSSPVAGKKRKANDGYAMLSCYIFKCDILTLN
jgi:chromosome segregation ATPase